MSAADKEEEERKNKRNARYFLLIPFFPNSSLTDCTNKEKLYFVR